MNGCGKAFKEGQWWSFCGETDMGQTSPALCVQCGGNFITVESSTNIEQKQRETMGMKKVENGLPEIGEYVICFGLNDDGETKVEEGFRSIVDDPDKRHIWTNFSFTVTHWVYSPVIEIE